MSKRVSEAVLESAGGDVHAALQLIQETAVKAAKAQIVTIPGDERRFFLVHNGEVDEKEFPAAVRAHTVDTLADLIAFGKTCLRPVIYHGDEAVVLVCDDNDRRDRVTFALPWSRQMQTLRTLEKRQLLDQKTLVRLLRLDLRADPAVIAPFRTLNWESGGKERGEVQRTRESLSSSVVSQIEGTDALPEELRLPVPVYDAIGEREPFSVLLLVEVDAAARQFIVTPAAGELLALVSQAQASIRRRLEAAFAGALKDEECRFEQFAIYQGKP